MQFHEFGKQENPLVLLIHGTLTPWQMWMPMIEAWKERYFLVVPALNGHVEEEDSEYLSAEAEAEEIASYVTQNYGVNAYLVCGLSMGGIVANKLLEQGILSIKHLILDGAPLEPMSACKGINKIAEGWMRKQYTAILHSSQKREKRALANFKKYFMPERYLQPFLGFADRMSDRSIANIVKAACNSKIVPSEGGRYASILFLHGTKGNEIIAKRAAKGIKKAYPQAVVKSFRGYAHAELCIFKPQEWIVEAEEFLKKQEVTTDKNSI